MRKFLAIAMLAPALALGACATDPTTGLPTINQQELANVEAQIQQTASNVCKFVPTVESVAAVIASYVSAGAVVDLVNQATNQICTAIINSPTPTTKSVVRGKVVRMLTEPVNVNGVAVTGYFIK